ncbi:phosphate signaling complex protein PhoU [Bombella sp. TMW 2.2543]|uniref:Phosphate-specific transport system accessory protein PhoU n=1 Tax=Bombella pluederhausensis TaxID=2967336 RepID=A0ABT3WHV4_9PROT|nr:phosphate signaling complex protein PhoU [Bombella pluederhausensis]MCX5618556.1 phosphate signaling complex protein PhoU [Bombella pluederhausensis]
MMQQRQHIVQRYEDELLRLRSLMEQMGGLVEHQLSLILASLAGNDTRTALEAAQQDSAVDALEHEIEALAIRLLALRGPMAVDLREIIACIPMASALERMGDYASSIARRLNQMDQPIPHTARTALHEMGRLVLDHLRRVMNALERKDAREAHAIWQADQLVDQYGNAMTGDCLKQMTHHPQTIRLHISLLFIIRNLERIGDHTTNMAERIVFMVTGTTLPSARPHAHDDGLSPP